MKTIFRILLTWIIRGSIRASQHDGRLVYRLHTRLAYIQDESNSSSVSRLRHLGCARFFLFFLAADRRRVHSIRLRRRPAPAEKQKRTTHTQTHTHTRCKSAAWTLLDWTGRMAECLFLLDPARFLPSGRNRSWNTAFSYGKSSLNTKQSASIWLTNRTRSEWFDYMRLWLLKNISQDLKVKWTTWPLYNQQSICLV